MNAFKDFFKPRDTEQLEETNMEAQEQEVPNTEPIEGKIIKVDKKGYGFITSQELPFERIFFHWTSLTQDTLKFPELKRGMHVEFIPVDKGDRGFHAIKVKIAEN